MKQSSVKHPCFIRKIGLLQTKLTQKLIKKLRNIFAVVNRPTKAVLAAFYLLLCDLSNLFLSTIAMRMRINESSLTK